MKYYILPFKEAREYVRKQKFLCTREFNEWAETDNRPTYIHQYPERVYKGDWTSWSDFIGFNKKTEYASFDLARDYVRSLKIRNQQDWFRWSRSNKRPHDIPTNPHYVYVEGRQGGWIDWRDWLGPYDKWVSFSVLKKMVKPLGFRSVVDYNCWFSKSDMNSYRDKIGCKLPSNPPLAYEEWISWQSFLNPPSQFLSFTKARKFARGLGIKSYKEWLEWCKSGKRPSDIPANPYSTYKGEFNDWFDWLGKRKRKRKNLNAKR